jgi:uncharacterized protein (DUF305 family)
MAPRSFAAVLTATLLLTGCSTAVSDEDGSASAVADEPTDGPRIIQPGAPGEPSRELSPQELAEIDFEVPHTDADVAFMQGMIPHHVQALRMTRLVPGRTGRDDVPLFAERMDLSQEDEIALMRRWLEERDEEVPSLLTSHTGDMADMDMDGMDAGELMPGMLTEQELAELEAATGEEFDRLFLEAMTRHHLGAIAMVEELYASDGAQEPEIARFANHVYADQQIEISRAEEMLAQIGAGS